MFQNNNFEARQEGNSYETGRTQPPKNHGGLIALLLIAVIFLSGIFSTMGYLNISPFSNEEPSRNGEKCLEFTPLSPEETTASVHSLSGKPCPGFTGEALSALDQQIYQLPEGIYITRIFPGSDAEKKGFSPGDILLRLGDQSTPDQDALNTVLAKHRPGDTIKAVIFRDGVQHIIHLILSEESR